PLTEADNPQPVNFCPPGVEGILCLRGPHVSPGYVESARNVGTFTENGWLVSGDLGYVDKEGRIFITGRSKDLIIRGGHNIDPQAIEEAFLANPDVLDAAAVGRPDAYAGELPIVFVTLKSGAAADPNELLSQALPRIAERPAVPKAVHILDAMPTTPIGKIFKPALRKLAAVHAVRDAIQKTNLADQCLVEPGEDSEFQCLIKVRDKEDIPALEQAVQGMPVKVGISLLGA